MQRRPPCQPTEAARHRDCPALPGWLTKLTFRLTREGEPERAERVAGSLWGARASHVLLVLFCVSDRSNTLSHMA